MSLQEVAEETWIDRTRLRQLEAGAEPTEEERLALEECLGADESPAA